MTHPSNTPSKLSSHFEALAVLCAIFIIPTLTATALPAIIFAKLAQKNINKQNSNLKGGQFAQLSAVCGYIGLTVFLAAFTYNAMNPPQRKYPMSNLRAIGQSLAALAPSNKNWWPGYNGNQYLDSSTIKINNTISPQAPNGSHPSVRLAYLIAQGELDPQTLISPYETNPNIKPFDPTKDKSFTPNHTSYALLHLGHPTPQYLNPQSPLPARTIAWNNSNSSTSPVVADRNTSSDPANPKSIWNQYFNNDPQTPYRGHVQFADTHVEYVKQANIQLTAYGSFTKKVTDEKHAQQTYGPGPNNADNLFTNEDQGKDALLIHKLD